MRELVYLKFMKVIGLKVDGYFFNMDYKNLTHEEFLRKIESVGLEVKGSIREVDNEGNFIKK